MVERLRLSEVSWNEKRHLINALESHRSGLAQESQAACQRYVQRALLAARPEPERSAWEYLHPESYDKTQLEAAITALLGAYEREQKPVYALKLAEYLMFLERYVDAVGLLKEAIARPLPSPDYIRLSYAAATLYRILGRPRAGEAEHMFAPGMIEKGIFVATPSIEDACSRLGLMAEDARRIACEYFSQVLKLDLHPDERPMVEESLQIMREMVQGRVRAAWEP
jgi:tetratricopeptide (TPR) repeat protein